MGKNPPKTEKKGRGRPSDYRPEYAEQARKLCLLGATDKQLADFFETSEQTINAWKHAHPDFLESLRAGKMMADAEIADALFHRAKGYSHEEDKIFQYEGAPVIVPTTKHYPPDPQAIALWLKNRQPDRWREKPEPPPPPPQKNDASEDYTVLRPDENVPEQPII